MKKMFTQSNLIRNSWILSLLVVMYVPISGQTTHMVDVTSNVFTPAEIMIHVGDTVVWSNKGGGHNVNGLQSSYPSNPESFGNDVGTGWIFSHVFTMQGVYDYHCDPHEGLGMTGMVTVMELTPDTLTVNFTGMTPHVGQTGWILVKDKDTGDEIERSSGTIEESFSLVIPGIVAGHSYTIEIFVDHNGNGYYDAPPTDHAWTLELNDANGNEVVDFAHNTDFTDIQWMHRLSVQFSGMTPHLGQMLTLYVRDLVSGDYLDTVLVSEIEDAEFHINSYAIETDGTYQIDFFADHNGNGMYDAPPVDHAWRLEIVEAIGDVNIEFSHNTDFTNIFETTGVDLNEQSRRISVYPNPATGRLYITSEETIESVSMIDVTGVRLREFRNIKATDFELNLDGISTGIYFVEVKTVDNELQIRRLVKR